MGAPRSAARLSAIASGQKHYTGKICKRHPELMGKRYTSDSSCPSCSIGYSTIWSRKKKAGFTKELFNATLALQGGACASCNREFDNTSIKACADHCHVLNVPRAILCRECNTIFGFLEKIGIENMERVFHNLSSLILVHPAWYALRPELLGNPEELKKYKSMFYGDNH